MMTDDATRYAHAIRETLEALEELSSLDLEGVSTLEELDVEELEELSPSARGELEELLRSGELESADGDPIRAYLDSALEVSLRGRLSLGSADGWTVESVELLVTFGGPSARVSADGSSSVLVSVSWWSESAELRVEVPTFAARLYELEELYATP